MKRFSLIYPYYDNPEMLKRHLDEWQNWAPELRDLATFIVVDDCSPTPALDEILQLGAEKLPVKVYRVKVDQAWGQDAARNIGMRETLNDWNLMTDMDHMLTRAGAERMSTFLERAKKGTYYMPARVRTSGAEYHAHPNTFLMHKDDFWRMGGYDEDFVGYYGSDGNFRKCCKGSGLVELHVAEWAMVLHGSSDCADANTRAFTRKEGPLWAAKNPFLNKKRMGPGYKAQNPFRQPYERVL